MIIIFLYLIAYAMAVGEYIPQLDVNGTLLPKTMLGVNWDVLVYLRTKCLQ